MPNPPTLTLRYASDNQDPLATIVLSGGQAVSTTLDDFPTDGATLSCWLMTTQDADAVLISYGAEPGDSSHQLSVANPSDIAVGYGASSTGSTGIAVNDGLWHQLTVTLAPSDATHYAVQIYLDGILRFQSLSSLSFAAGGGLQADGTLVLGMSLPQGTTGGFEGRMSNFRLWSGVFSAQRIVTDLWLPVADLQTQPLLEWQLTSAATSGTLSGDPTFSASTLRLRTQVLLASWTEVTGASSYNLLVDAIGGCWIPLMQGLPGLSTTIPSYLLNQSYSAKVQAVVDGVPGPFSDPVEIRTLNLLPPIDQVDVDFQAQTIAASWPAVDQAQQYEVELDPNDSGNLQTSLQTGTRYDLQTLIDSEDAWTYRFRTESLGSAGPRSAVTALDLPSLIFIFQGVGVDGGSLLADWTAVDNADAFYLEVFRVDGGTETRVWNRLYAPQELETALDSIVAEDGQVYRARIRAAGLGRIGAWTEKVEVTVHKMLAPNVTSAEGDPEAHTIDMAWVFGDTSLPDLVYKAQLFTDPQGMDPVQSKETGNTSTQFEDRAIQDGTNWLVRVRAQSQGSYSPYSALYPVAVNSLPLVENVQAFAQNNKDVDVTWSSANVPGATYRINLRGPVGETTVVDVTQDAGESATRTTFPFSETQVQEGKTYRATVWLVLGEDEGPKNSDDVTIRPSDKPPIDNPTTHHSGDPINTSVGNYGYASMELQVVDVIPLQFSIHYNSAIPSAIESSFYDGKPLGERWTHSYNIRLIFTSDGRQVQVLWGNGAADTYRVPSSGSGVYPHDGTNNGDVLELGQNQVFTLTTKYQDVYSFTQQGRLTEFRSAAGNPLNFSYDVAERLERVENPLTEKFLEFAYQPDGYLETASDNGGRQVRFSYDAGNLATVVDVAGHTRTFQYDSGSLMSLVESEGKGILRNVWQGALGNPRVVFQQDARAIQEDQDYGDTFSYSRDTVDGLPVIVTAHSDRDGNTATFVSVEANGNTLSQTYDMGTKVRKISSTFDASGNKLTETFFEGPKPAPADGVGNTTTRTYDGLNNLLTVTNPLGRRTASFTYNARNQVLSYTDALGNAMSLTYGSDDLLETITDALGRTMRLTYQQGNIRGLAETIIDYQGNTFRFTQQDGLLRTVTNPLGEVSQYEFDEVGRKTLETVLDLQSTALKTTKIEFFASGQVRTLSAQMGTQSEEDAFTYGYTYDDQSNLETLTDPEGNRLTFGYDPNNLLESIVYPPFGGMSRETGCRYDRLDFLTGVDFSTSLAIAEAYVSDRFGRVVRYQDPEGNVYHYEREFTEVAADNYNSTTTKFFPELAEDPGKTYTEVLEWDAAGRLIRAVTRNGREVTCSYAILRDEDTSTNQLGVTTTFPPEEEGAARLTQVRLFDALGRLIALTNEADQTTTIRYEVVRDPATSLFNLKVTVTDPVGNRTVNTLDPLGRVIGVVQGDDSTQREWKYAYDALSRVLQASEKLDGTFVDTKIAYAFDSETKRFQAGVGRPGDDQSRTIQQFDGLGQLRSETDALGNASTLTYSPWDGLLTYQDSMGRLLQYGYDDAGRYRSTTFESPARVVEQILDKNSNRIQTQVDGANAIARGFDAWNRMLSRTSDSQTVSYEYWPDNLVKTLTYPDAKAVSYAYDGLDRLRTVTDWNERETSYIYWPAGNVKTAAFPNGLVGSFDFDAAGQLTSFSYLKAPSILTQVSYALDALGNRRTVQSIVPLRPTIPEQPTTMTYDAANRAITFDGQALDSDSDGNLLTVPRDGELVTAGYDVFNRVESLGDDRYGYDADGLRTLTLLDGVERRYVHDVGGYSSPMVEMASPLRTIGHSSVLANGQGTPSVTAEPLIAGVSLPLAAVTDRTLVITDDQGAAQSRLVYGQGLIGLEDGSGIYRVPLFDSRGSTLALTDERGRITDRYAYDPYGGLAGRQGAAFNPFLYNGRDGVLDDGNGLLYARARSYDPQLRRFLQSDYLFGDVNFPQSLNRYAYVLGNPISLVDPLGLSGKRDLAIGLGIAGAALVGLGLAGLGAAAYFGGAAGVGGGAAAGGLGGGAIELVEFSSSVETTPQTHPLVERPGLRRRIPFSQRAASTRFGASDSLLESSTGSMNAFSASVNGTGSGLGAASFTGGVGGGSAAVGAGGAGAAGAGAASSGLTAGVVALGIGSGLAIAAGVGLGIGAIVVAASAGRGPSAGTNVPAQPAPGEQAEAQLLDGSTRRSRLFDPGNPQQPQVLRFRPGSSSTHLDNLGY